MKRIFSLLATATVMLFLAAEFMDSAEARSRAGGRSFGGGSSLSRSTAPPRQPSATQTTQAARPAGPLGGSFGRGLAGGLLGGFLGGMLFSGMAHGSGMGGLGGSGFGLIEILLLAGLAYFLFRKFARRGVAGAGAGTQPIPGRGAPADMFTATGARPSLPDAPGEDPLVAGVKDIWQVDESFDPDGFKEVAQDLFFKIQAGWTRRDAAVLRGLLGDRLLAEYEGHFADMRREGRINRLENIAVRSVDLVAAGVEGPEIFVTVRFTANLLDYTLDEKTGEVVDGDRENPVKFQEEWTFAHPVGDRRWKLEGIAA